MTQERLKEDLREIEYRPALLVIALFSAIFLIASIGSVIGGKASNVLVIIVSLPLSLFSLPLIDSLENTIVLALVLYGLNFLLGAVFWFSIMIVVTNFKLFLARRKLDYALVILVILIILAALLFKSLRSYGFFLGLEGASSWKNGCPHKRVHLSSTTPKGKMMVGGLGWVAVLLDGNWYYMKVPGSSGKSADSLVSRDDGTLYAKFGNDVFEINKNKWKRIPLKRSSGRLALSKNGDVLLVSVEGVTILRGETFQPIEIFGDCVPGETDIFTDSRGRHWMGGALGNIACVLDGRKLQLITLKGKDADQPASDSAVDFIEDTNGDIYFGSASGSIYSVKDTTAQPLAFKYPVGAGPVRSMLSTGTREFVVAYTNPSVSGGIFKIDLNKWTITPQSFQGMETLKYPCCLVRDTNGKIWFGSNRGMYLLGGDTDSRFR